MKINQSINAVNKMITIKERFIGIGNSVSGIASLLGSWQICHTICLGVVALLALIGITVKGFPFLFLNTLAAPLWLTAAFLFSISLIMYLKKGCISERMLLFNMGILIAAVPFQAFQKYLPFLWASGGIIVASSIILFLKEKVIKLDRDGYIMIIILVVAVIALVFSISGFFANIIPAEASIEKPLAVPASQYSAVETGSTEQGDVSVILTPIDVSDTQAVFDVAINTHSVDLSVFDLKEMASLEYNGNVAKPSDTPQLSGHHNSGRIVFQTTSRPKEFTVKIIGIPNVQERIFSWR